MINSSDQQKWRRMKTRQISDAEALLQSREACCMNACSRFINRKHQKNTIWTLGGSDGKISALIIISRQSLLPVLGGQDAIPHPRFLKGLFSTTHIHSLQGGKQDVVLLENALEKTGLCAAEKIDFDIMYINHPPSGYDSAGPASLVIRKPQPKDMDDLAALHAAYEQEEVLPAASEFNVAVSRMNIERIYANERMLAAELGGRLVGKINTNAETFTCCQIGGVYVHPDYRGLGIARRMAGEFTASLVSRGKGISLFVKKSNAAARRVYERTGFAAQGDYRINYY
jgi:ribosomal protein S18 acetylase RimI-like enzyme